MGKRIVRITSSQLPERVAELAQRQINVVLKSGQTVYGKFQKADNYFLLLHDNRAHLHTLAYTQIDEVIYDQSTAF
jgi:small nuclear ribonucleoprotein (snRNP)-like protein